MLVLFSDPQLCRVLPVWFIYSFSELRLPSKPEQCFKYLNIHGNISAKTSQPRGELKSRLLFSSHGCSRQYVDMLDTIKSVFVSFVWQSKQSHRAALKHVKWQKWITLHLNPLSLYVTVWAFKDTLIWLRVRVKLVICSQSSSNLLLNLTCRASEK